MIGAETKTERPQTVPAIQTTGVGTVDAAERLLAERALRLARGNGAGSAETEHAEQAQDVLVCLVADEQYAVPLGALLSVQRAHGLVPVPCAPRHVAGILNVRGEVAPVLDLAVLLGLGSVPMATANDADGDTRVLLVEAACAAGGGAAESGSADLAGGSGRVGLLVDGVVGVRQLRMGSLAKPLSSREYILGISNLAGGAPVTYLDIARLLAAGGVVVNEDAG